MWLRRGCKGVEAIALDLRDGVMQTGRGVGAAESTLVDVAAGVTAGDGGMVESVRGVGGASTGGGDGGGGSTEGVRVNSVSVGVEIDVTKILAMSWIACK